jgi:uncharacterized circularly permuted ATP-grasp superfamily protein
MAQAGNRLIQRATLLNKILADCYGNQDLIRSRWLLAGARLCPAGFFAALPWHRGRRTTISCIFTPPTSRVRPTAAGGWFPTAPRFPPARATRWPTAWSPRAFCRNRSATNNVHRLAGFFREVQETLAQLAPRRRTKPRVVMLTPGPHNETYFEQAYLARYLGYMLVEGQDLTVRDNHVFLKTLSGLERVDVICAAWTMIFATRLELRNDSILGVPGLVEAIRAGNVVVANALGSGLVQSPAFMSFLPGLCRHIWARN